MDCFPFWTLFIIQNLESATIRLELNIPVIVGFNNFEKNITKIASRIAPSIKKELIATSHKKFDLKVIG